MVRVLLVSKVVIVVFGLSMGALSVVLNAIGLSLGWVYMFMGTAIGSAVVPLWNMLMWKNANAAGAVVGAWGGMLLALISWVVTTQVQSGEITVETLGKLEPNLVGNLVAIISSGLIHVGFSLAKPQNYDFVSMGRIQMLEDDQRGLAEEDFGDSFLNEAKAWIQKWGWGFTILMVVVWPILSLPAGVFSDGYWSMWVFISIAWAFAATIVIIVLPVYESLDAITSIVSQMTGLKLGRGVAATEAAGEKDPSASGAEGGKATEAGE